MRALAAIIATLLAALSGCSSKGHVKSDWEVSANDRPAEIADGDSTDPTSADPKP